MGTLLHTIELYRRATGMTASRFGREAVGDPRLVYDLRHGRDIRAKTRERINAYLSGPRTPYIPRKPGERNGRWIGQWDEADCLELLAIIALGGTKEEAAAKLRRSERAVHARLHLLIDERLPERPKFQRTAASAQQILASAKAICLNTSGQIDTPPQTHHQPTQDTNGIHRQHRRAA